MPVSDRYSTRVIVLSGPVVGQLILDQDLNATDYGKLLLEMLNYIN